MGRAWVNLWLALAFMACAAVVVAIWEAPAALQSNLAASWVQAIGSIAAIFGSAGVAIWISERERRRRAEESKAARIVETCAELRFLDEAVLIANSGLRTAENNYSTGRWTPGGVGLVNDHLRHGLSMMASVRAHVLPHGVVTKLGFATASVVGTVSMLEDLKTLPTLKGLAMPVHSIAVGRQNLDELSQSIRDYLTRHDDAVHPAAG